MRPSRVAAYLLVFARTYLRSRVGLFFSLIFPIILILLFGSIFSNTGSSSSPVYVQNLDGTSVASQMFLTSLNATGAVSVHMVSSSVGNLSTWLVSKGYTAGIVLPAGFQTAFAAHRPVKVIVYTDPAQPSTAGIVQGAVGYAVTSMNYAQSGQAPVVGTVELNVGSTTYQYIDYLVPGLIGFSILTSPMFSMTNIAAQYKKQKLFRQLSLTPLTRGEWLAASVLWYLVLVFASTVVMLAVGRGLFGATATPTLLTIPFLIFGPMLFVSLGLLLGTFSKTPESAAVVGNLVTFPMMFLSGTFFPVSLFPDYLQAVAHVLPLYYVIDGLNNTMVFQNTTGALTDLLVVVALAVLLFLAAIRAFRWQEE